MYWIVLAMIGFAAYVLWCIRNHIKQKFPLSEESSAEMTDKIHFLNQILEDEQGLNDLAILTDHSSATQWFYLENQKQVGPLSLDELLELLATTCEEDRYDVLVWNKTMPTWQPVKAIEVLTKRLESY